MEPTALNDPMKLPVDELYDFVENASLALHWVDKDGIIIWANQAELDMLSYTKEEYVGFPIASFHADQVVINDILSRLTNNETLINYRADLKCKDGSIRHVLINSNVYTKENEFIHTRCFTRDVSDIVLEAVKRAELVSRLEESEGLLKISRDIIQSSYDAIISKDLNGLVTSWNNAAETMFGYTSSEMLGKPIAILMPIDRLYEEHEIYDRLRLGEHVQHFETKRITKDKRTLDVSLSISPIKDRSGSIIGLSKIVRDITERKTEEMRKNAFVGMVSHELKTPLTSIQGYLQILSSKAKKTEDNFNISALARAEAQVRKMVSMVHDFLNVDRLAEGKIHLKKEEFDLHQLLQESIDDITIIANGAHMVYQNGDSITVYADRDKIGQVLNNLIGNAIKYSPKDSSVSILCQKNGDLVTIAIKDNGIGISAKDQLRLFDRYYRVENEVTAFVKGFGIGLYLVAEILRLHNTTIQVSSTEGQGSTFSFSLPIV